MPENLQWLTWLAPPLLGALIGSGETPVTEEVMKKTIGTSTKKAFLESNLKAFDFGKEAAVKAN